MEKISQTISTLEIAEMMSTRHSRILRKLEGHELKGKHIKGIIEILNDNKIIAVDYFIKSTYSGAMNVTEDGSGYYWER